MEVDEIQWMSWEVMSSLTVHMQPIRAKAYPFIFHKYLF